MGLRLLCHGVGSEYPLRGFAAEARRRGHEVVEIDMYVEGWRAIIDTFAAAGPFVMLTSHHPYMDAWRHEKEFGIKGDIEALPQIIGRWKPVRTYYVPHDFREPFKDEELHALGLFDGLLMPDESWWFVRQYTRLEIVGWVKTITQTHLPPCDLTFMPSEIAYYARTGVDAFMQMFAPVITFMPRIKFPKFPGIELFEMRVRQMGADVIAAETDSTALLASTRLVISNGLSSIIEESSILGIPAICVADGCHPESIQRLYYQNHPTVKVVPRDFLTQQITELLKSTTQEESNIKKMLPLDFDKVFRVLQMDT